MLAWQSDASVGSTRGIAVSVIMFGVKAPYKLATAGIADRIEDTYRDQLASLVPRFNAFNVIVTRSQVMAEVALGGRIGRTIGVAVPLPEGYRGFDVNDPRWAELEEALRRSLDDFIAERGWQRSGADAPSRRFE